jgi:flagellum-specific peptidoglycan hydrolase FlgJ
MVRGDELAKLPVIKEITDTYKIGWEQTVRLSGELAAHIITVDETERFTSGDGLEAGRDRELSVNVSWERSKIEQKLREQGWSSGKMKAAGAYLDYIDRYMDEAIRDMYASRVSASITLAQGILESDAGRSHLARVTNNHFGIKARPNREGRRKIKAKQFNQLKDRDFNYSAPAIGVSQHYDDNKYDRFEVYTDVLDSYRRHSRLLQNTCKKARKGCYAWIWTSYPVQKERVDLTEMAEVFERVSGYRPRDFFGETRLPYYAAQAAGLKMAGYATSKTYHKKLVYLIETYELWRFDIALVQAVG